MADHTENALGAMSKALRDIVAPAVDPSDPIAGEQLQSATRYLDFLAQRLDYLHERQRFELDHAVRLARALSACAAEVSAPLSDELSAEIARGTELLDQCSTDVPAMRAAVVRLAATTRELVRAAAAASSDLATNVERLVLDATEERILFERAWYLPLGFDHSPSEVPAVTDVLLLRRD